MFVHVVVDCIQTGSSGGTRVLRILGERHCPLNVIPTQEATLFSVPLQYTYRYVDTSLIRTLSLPLYVIRRGGGERGEGGEEEQIFIICTLITATTDCGSLRVKSIQLQ